MPQNLEYYLQKPPQASLWTISRCLRIADDVTIAAGILASENSCVDSKVAGSNPHIPVARDDTMVMVNYLSNKGCESYHNESNNSSEIIIKPMVALALE